MSGTGGRGGGRRESAGRREGRRREGGGLRGGGRRGGGTRVVRAARATAGNWLPYVAGVALFFLAAALVGAVVGHERRSPVIPVRAPGDPVPALEPLDLFLRDAQVAALIVVGVIFVLPSIALVGYTAFVFGATIAEALASLGPVATVATLLPHGVFELPAIWLAGAVALRWTHVVWQTTRGGDRRVSVGRTVTETVLALVAVALLLVIAAVVEGTITEDLARTLT